MKALLSVAVLSALLMLAALTGCAPSRTLQTNGKIVFQSDRDGNYNLWIMNADGSQPNNLTRTPPSNTVARGNIGPVPSPDGQRIAFESNRDGNDEIYVIDVRSGIQQNLTKNRAHDYSPTWSPDETRIAFVSDRDALPVVPERGISSNNVYIMQADGSDVRRLTIDNSTAGYNGLSWSPDGEKLALGMSDLTPFGAYYAMGISVMTVDVSSLVRLTAPSASMSCCAKWSPDGSHIVYSAWSRGFENIYVMKSDGSEQTALTQGTTYYDIDPSWSPDGRYILFSSNRDGQYHIYVMNTDGSDQRRLTGEPGQDRFPVWLPAP